MVLGFQVGVVREQANYGVEHCLGHCVPGSQVTKEGARQTVLQHGERRPEGPQQGGGGRDGAAGLPSVPLAVGPRGPRGAVYRGLPPPAALLDARVVRQIHLHPYHSP